MPEVAGQNQLNQAIAIGADRISGSHRHALFVVPFSINENGELVQEGSNDSILGQIKNGLGISETLILFRNETIQNTPFRLATGALKIWDLNIINKDSSVSYVKIFNTNTPTVGTDIPIFTIKVEGNSTYYWKPVPVYNLTAGSAIAVTTGLSSSDSSSPSTGCFVEGRISSENPILSV